MRVLGIDPGLRITGYACVEGAGRRLVEAGVIRLGGGAAKRGEKGGARDASGGAGDRARASELLAARLMELDADVREVLERLKPEAAAVEALFAHYKHPATAIGMAHARGVILLNVRRAGIRLVEFRPNAVKKFLTGHGHAGKVQMQDAVRDRLGLSARPEPADVADAIAIALCGSWRLASAT
ncbi:MAG: crossover junction endodeoxyribonuclease RuvC [Phycisphaerales bacterium]